MFSSELNVIWGLWGKESLVPKPPKIVQGYSMIKNVNVQARNCEVDDAMRKHFESKLQGLEKMSSHLDEAEVRLRHERGQYVAEVTLIDGGLVTRAEERAPDMRQAFDAALHKLQSQLRRYKDKSQNTGRRHNNRDDQNGVVRNPKTSPEVTAAATLAPLSMPARDYGESAATRQSAPTDADPEEADMDALMDDEAPASLVRVKRFALKPMSPDEAALQMDLLGHDFFVFRNSRDNAVGVVYRRNSGGYGLIEPVPD